MLMACVASQLFTGTLLLLIDGVLAQHLPKQVLSLKVGVLSSCYLLSQGQLQTSQGVHQHSHAALK